MRTIKLVLEYCGAGLSGWQRQDNGPSVQAHVEDALAEMTGAPTRIVGASRTDAGVHARGQVAHFTTESAIPARGFRGGLNALLPPGVACVDAADAADGFHARFDSLGKHYRYAILSRADRPGLDRDRVWHRPRPLDLDAMRAAAAHLIGEHDFASFRAAGCSARTTTRRLHALEIAEKPFNIIQIDVYGDAFMRHMVRIVTGTLVQVGIGRMAADELVSIRDASDRTRAGPTAPARGLTLMRVFYDRPAAP